MNDPRLIAALAGWLLVALSSVQILPEPDAVPTLRPTPTPSPTITRHPLATATPTLTPTPYPPIWTELGLETVARYRIDTWEIWHVGGGSVNGVMMEESDALVLARVAVGEGFESHDDRWYVMWNVRLRAELGFKNAGAYGGWKAMPDRWGPPTTIKREALCDAGCQYQPVAATSGVYFPWTVRVDNVRNMIWPDDEFLDRFDHAVHDAEAVLSLPITAYPAELRGYDGFRSPDVAWKGTYYHKGGLPSIQLTRGGQIWRDAYPQDNEFWKRIADCATDLKGDCDVIH